MLKREQELRLSPERQSEMAASQGNWLDVVEEIQKQVIKEFGFSYNPAFGLELLRSVSSFFYEIDPTGREGVMDPEVCEAAHWIKFNRAPIAQPSSTYMITTAMTASFQKPFALPILHVFPVVQKEKEKEKEKEFENELKETNGVPLWDPGSVTLLLAGSWT